MSLSQAESAASVPLESVICTQELNLRQARQPDHQAVNGALVSLAQTMANSPERILQQLVETALNLCLAHSSGLSLLEEENDRKIFRWHGVAGRYESHFGHNSTRFIDGMGGRIWAEAAPGRGATFYFTCPHDWSTVA